MIERVALRRGRGGAFLFSRARRRCNPNLAKEGFAMRMGRAISLVMIALTLLGASAALAAPSGGKRVALVIGNGAYRKVDALTNPENDARMIAQTLKDTGFELIGGGA